MTSVQRYGGVAMTLHWLVAIAIVAQYVLAEQAEDLPMGAEKFELLALHKSIGIAILGAALLRIGWRFAHPPPPLPETVAAWQVRVSAIVHWLLYVLILAVPVTGWLLSSAAGVTVNWFGVLLLPDFVAASESLAETLSVVHEWLAKTMFVLALVHIGAALKHQFVDGTGVLLRMLPGRAS